MAAKRTTKETADETIAPEPSAQATPIADPTVAALTAQVGELQSLVGKLLEVQLSAPRGPEPQNDPKSVVRPWKEGELERLRTPRVVFKIDSLTGERHEATSYYVDETGEYACTGWSKENCPRFERIAEPDGTLIPIHRSVQFLGLTQKQAPPVVNPQVFNPQAAPRS